MGLPPDDLSDKLGKRENIKTIYCNSLVLWLFRASSTAATILINLAIANTGTRESS